MKVPICLALLCACLGYVFAGGYGGHGGGFGGGFGGGGFGGLGVGFAGEYFGGPGTSGYVKTLSGPAFLVKDVHRIKKVKSGQPILAYSGLGGGHGGHGW